MIKMAAIKPSAKAINFTRFADAAKLGMKDAAEAARALEGARAIMFQMKAIIPKELAFEPKRQKAAVSRAMDSTAIRVQSMFDDTTSTWNHDVKFAISVVDWNERTITTDDQVYGYVNNGTGPHLIAPRNARMLRFATGYRAKTQPGTIGSGSGGANGPVVYLKGVVRHPGTKARKFDKQIAKLFGPRLAEAIRNEFAKELP